MKILIAITTIALIACGCATQKRVATLEGRGASQTYSAPFDQVWRATIDAAQRNGLEILSADRASGYIAAHRSLQAHTFGENVGVWVRQLAPVETKVEVVSRQAGPPVAWLKNWENEILRTVAVNLTREPPVFGAAPRETIIQRGAGSDTTIIVPDSRGRDVVVSDSAMREALRQELRQLEIQRQVREQALSSEVDEARRLTIQREIDRLRTDIRLQEQRLRDLERDLK